MKNHFLMLLAAASLVACGSSDDSPTADAGTGPAQVATDPFITVVEGVIAMPGDNSESVAVDAGAASAPDDAQAVPVS